MPPPVRAPGPPFTRHVNEGRRDPPTQRRRPARVTPVDDGAAVRCGISLSVRNEPGPDRVLCFEEVAFDNDRQTRVSKLSRVPAEQLESINLLVFCFRSAEVAFLDTYVAIR